MAVKVDIGPMPDDWQPIWSEPKKNVVRGEVPVTLPDGSCRTVHMEYYKSVDGHNGIWQEKIRRALWEQAELARLAPK